MTRNRSDRPVESAMNFFRQPPSIGVALVPALLLLATGLIGCAKPGPSPGTPGAGPKPAPQAPPVATDRSTAPEKGEAASPFKIERRAAKKVDGVGDTVACPRFEDVHVERGLEHVYLNGERGESLMVEAIGGGAGWIDFDRDGQWDLYANQGGDPAVKDRSGEPIDRLFRRLPTAPNGPIGGFVDVTAACGIVERGYGQGVAVGDFDDDGFDDIYVTNVGANSLFRNLGDGKFIEETERAGVGDERWSSSAAWADLDLDGDLDLYVCNYVKYDPLDPMDCRNGKGQPRICHPRDVEHWPDECYENLGDGRFRPVAKQWGLEGPGNKALGVAIADFSNDGRPDIYVANDTTANFLFVGGAPATAGGDPVFTESAVLLGCAVDRNGMAQASMGLAVGDYDANGWLDVYSTHFYDESNTLYRNLGATGFEDVTGIVGLHEPTLARLGFGTVMADFNQDGWPELFVANGHVENYPGNPLLKMKAQLFAFNGSRFQDCSSAAGPSFDTKVVGRGVAAADYDADGDLDLVVVHQNTPAALLENRSARGHWLSFEAIGRRSNRRGIGCRVTVKAGNREWMQEIAGGTSYASTHQPLLVFGLGEASGPCTVEIRWPLGATQRLEDVAVDQALVLREPDVAAGVEPRLSALRPTPGPGP